MKIKVERSGGLTGIPFYREVDTGKLPPTLQGKLRKILESPKPLRSVKPTPRGAGDYYVYKILINDGSSKRTIECNQYDISEDIKALVKYLEKNPNKK